MSLPSADNDLYGTKSNLIDCLDYSADSRLCLLSLFSLISASPFANSEYTGFPSERIKLLKDLTAAKQCNQVPATDNIHVSASTRLFSVSAISFPSESLDLTAPCTHWFLSTFAIEQFSKPRVLRRGTHLKSKTFSRRGNNPLLPPIQTLPYNT